MKRELSINKSFVLLGEPKVEEYLNLAKQFNIDAVITISNQFATTPTHHPLTINKNKTRSVELYHFSWLSLKSKAVLFTGNKQVDDPEQAYILSELVRYLDHDSSGGTHCCPTNATSSYRT